MANGPYPVFAYGKDKTGSVTGNAVPGQTVFDLGPAHGFIVGDLFFISRFTDTAIQYLGPIVEVDGNDVTTTWPLNGSKGLVAKVWTAPAGQIVAFSNGASGGYLPTLKTNISHLDTPGGTAVSTQVGFAVEKFTLSFSPVQQADWLAFEIFISTKRRYGLDTFFIGFQDWKVQSEVVYKVKYVKVLLDPSFGKSSNFANATLLFRLLARDLYE